MFPNTEQDIREQCDALAEMLIAKNRAYGDSALAPMRCFSKADTVEQLKVRIDDKLSRMMRGKETDKFPEDLVKDLLGYLILLRIAENRRHIQAQQDERARECAAGPAPVLHANVIDSDTAERTRLARQHAAPAAAVDKAPPLMGYRG